MSGVKLSEHHRSHDCIDIEMQHHEDGDVEHGGNALQQCANNKLECGQYCHKPAYAGDSDTSKNSRVRTTDGQKAKDNAEEKAYEKAEKKAEEEEEVEEEAEEQA